MHIKLSYISLESVAHHFGLLLSTSSSSVKVVTKIGISKLKVFLII